MRPGTIRAIGGVVVLLSLACATGAAASPRPTVGSKALLSQLQRGKPVSMEGVTVVGALKLDRLGVVKAAFACRHCSFDGGLVARGVSFRASVDLGGSTIKGPLLMRGATFAAPAFFATGVTPKSTFEGPVDFSFARFEDTATFRDASFYRKPSFFSTTFLGASDFSDSRFRRGATFENADFGQDARFTSATSAANISLSDASFAGGFDCRFCDLGRLELVDCEFGKGADFSESVLKTAVFDASRFGGDAVFRQTHVGSLSFAFAPVQGDLDFTGAIFDDNATFYGVATKGAASFKDATFAKDKVIDLTNVSAAEFSMDLSDVPHVFQRRTQQHVLALIGSTAKARQDFGLANTAYYQLQVNRSAGYDWPERAIDFLFYRLIAGYLIKPEHPLAAILVLVLVASLARSARAAAAASAGSRAWAAAKRWPREFVSTGRTTIPKATNVSTLPAARQAEVVIYRILLACVIVALYTKPAIRDTIDLVK